MSDRRLTVLIDRNCPLSVVDRELESFRAWTSSLGWTDISLELILFGQRASWVPGSIRLSTSALQSTVGSATRPNLADALSLASARPAPAWALLLASEPQSGWQDLAGAAGAAPPFQAAVALGGSNVPSVLGQGHFGALFRGEHLPLALRWLACEVRDRTWACACGELRVLGERRACPHCGAASVPRRLEIGGRIVLLTPGAALFAHHRGQPLDFDEPPMFLDPDVLADGPTELGGVAATVRCGPPIRAHEGMPLEAPLRAQLDRCHSCAGPLCEPVLHLPPDPRRFCAACTSSPFRCDFCGSPVGARGGNLWPDGRTACAECWTTATTDLSAVDALARAARQFMAERLAMEVPDCPNRLEHAAAIAALHGRTFRPEPGVNARPIGFFVPEIAGGPFICVEHGTPRSIAHGVLAHELTHFWQSRHWPTEVARPLLEGLAMWVEYQALLAAGAIHAARHSELYGDPVYGLGFRLALEMERRFGTAQVKDRLHEITRWPP